MLPLNDKIFTIAHMEWRNSMVPQTNILDAQTKATISRVTHKLRKKIDHSLQQQRDAFARSAAERAEINRKNKILERWDARKVERGIRLALQGLKNIAALGQTPEIQEFLALQSRRRPQPLTQFCFYHAQRPHGNEWETKGKESGHGIDIVAYVYLRETCIEVDFGPMESIEDDSIRFAYVDSPKKWEDTLHKMNIFTPSILDQKADTLLAQRVHQWTYAWEGEIVLLQVLRDCADETKFQDYLKRALRIPVNNR